MATILRDSTVVVVVVVGTANHDNHEKITSWVTFSFLYGYGAPLAALRAAGAPL